MASKTLLLNADVLTADVSGPTWIHVDNGATFNGGTVALKFIDDTGAAKPMQDSAGAVVAYAAGADDFYDFPAHTQLTLTMQGAAGATSVYVQVRTEPRR